MFSAELLWSGNLAVLMSMPDWLSMPAKESRPTPLKLAKRVSCSVAPAGRLGLCKTPLFSSSYASPSISLRFSNSVCCYSYKVLIYWIFCMVYK